MVLDKLILISFPIILLINFLFVRNYQFLFLKKTRDNEFHKPQAFHYISTPRIGGFLIFFFIIVFLIIFSKKNLFFSQIIYLGVIFFFLGFLEDFKLNIKPELRLFLMLIVSFSIIYFLDLKINNYQFLTLNNFINSNKIVSSLFVCLCLIFIVNGCNFIDGFNGLLIIHTIIILGILYFINSQNYNSGLINYFIFFCIIVCFSVLIFNFPQAKIFLGDGGAYFLGAIISLLTIEISNLNKEISPFFFACILFYIFFEVFFSFFRKIIFLKSSPFKPDKNHLHMLVYKFLFSKLKKNRLANYITGILVNLSYFFLIIPLFFFYNDKIFCQMYFLFLLIVYLLIYLWLKEKLVLVVNKF